MSSVTSMSGFAMTRFAYVTITITRVNFVKFSLGQKCELRFCLFVARLLPEIWGNQGLAAMLDKSNMAAATGVQLGSRITMKCHLRT